MGESRNGINGWVGGRGGGGKKQVPGKNLFC